MGAIENRKHPWEWDASDPLERTLSECCVSQPENRPSLDSILQALNPMVRAFTHGRGTAYDPRYPLPHYLPSYHARSLLRWVTSFRFVIFSGGSLFVGALTSTSPESPNLLAIPFQSHSF